MPLGRTPPFLGPPVRIGDEQYKPYARSGDLAQGDRYVEYQPGADVHHTSGAQTMSASGEQASGGIGLVGLIVIFVVGYMILNEKGGKR